MGGKTKICFVCTGNSCRSQIAEGFAKKMLDGKVKVYSAGSRPLGYILPKTAQVMKEVGIDISKQRSKPLDKVPIETMDYLISLCDSAAKYCPAVLSKGVRLHWPFPDPYDAPDEEQTQMKAFRDVRDAIEKKLKEWLPGLKHP